MQALRPAQTPLWERDTDSDLWGQILFGSGARHEEMTAVERDYERMFRSLAVSPERVDAVMGGTAARLLGVSAD
jgi:hypothetical protein